MLRILPGATAIRTMEFVRIPSTEGIRTPNSSCDQGQTLVTFCLDLQRSCNVKHACSGNLSDTVAENPRIKVDFKPWRLGLGRTDGSLSSDRITIQLCLSPRIKVDFEAWRHGLGRTGGRISSDRLTIQLYLSPRIKADSEPWRLRKSSHTVDIEPARSTKLGVELPRVN
ncbi:hypothetical protein TNCV_2591731 [Trichonephila clavipes]|nr:hypothetical protein TNCV_2591731 [Trichonephila clavipes]